MQTIDLGKIELFLPVTALDCSVKLLCIEDIDRSSVDAHGR